MLAAVIEWALSSLWRLVSWGTAGEVAC